MGLIDNKGVVKVPPTFNHLFEKESLYYITYTFHPDRSTTWREGKFHEACVHLKDGGATSRQNFYDDDQNALVKQVNDFIATLK